MNVSRDGSIVVVGAKTRIERLNPGSTWGNSVVQQFFLDLEMFKRFFLLDVCYVGELMIGLFELMSPFALMHVSNGGGCRGVFQRTKYEMYAVYNINCMEIFARFFYFPFIGSLR